MNHKIFILTSLLVFTFPTQAQIHSHGEGRLFISQDENQWLIQFILPAADIFGFEHAPETEEQRTILARFKSKLKNNDQVIQLGNQCTLENVEFLSETPAAEAHRHSNEHHDIEFSYRFNCDSPVTRISIFLFEWAESLQQIEASWFHDNGQGINKLERNKPFIAW